MSRNFILDGVFSREDIDAVDGEKQHTFSLWQDGDDCYHIDVDNVKASYIIPEAILDEIIRIKIKESK
jgi:hypothetical protein